ncbi:unnamed protein product, partial [Mesorhabditis belari]|uniref:Uncharacterized protein n=1 Tax=Mesorhabditis belari TaxID=2138241 RepID=A0AAF3F1P3_9BILA
MDVVGDVGPLVGHDLFDENVYYMTENRENIVKGLDKKPTILQIYSNLLPEVAQDELVVEDGSDWMIEDPNVAHEETVDDAFQRSADLELLELDELIDVGGEGDGYVGLSLNLNDLLSKAIEFEGNERIVVCFSKKGRPQLAAEGFLYNAIGYYNENYECQWRCVNPSCPAKLRSSPGFTELSYLCSTHLSSCIPDDLQLRLRIAIFDLRLVAEFTDHPLEDIHRNFLLDLWNKSPEVAQIFPPFETLARTLQQHRTEKSYRRRFELQHSKAQRMTIDSMSLGKKTKPLPLATCFLCGDQMRSSDIPSQDMLIGHVQNIHSKPELSIGQFTFADAASFEQWIRAVLASAAQTPDCRLKKYGVFDECMYYLCANDSRQMLKKRHEAVEELHSSCTAFVRVRDFRNAREKSSPIIVDYNLDHWSHSETILNEPLIPEYFMEHLKAKRKRTQDFLQDTKLQRVSRVAAMGATSAVISTRLVNSGEKVIAAAARRQNMPNPITAFQFSNQGLDHGRV